MTTARVALEHLILTDPRGQERPAAVEALVARARRGDAEAFAALVSQFEKKVLTTAWRFLQNREDAMDAAQESFLRAHKYLDSYDGPDFAAWLYRITVNVSREATRRRAPPRAEAAIEGGARSSGDVARHHLDEALATLTEKEHAAFVMRDLDGRSTDEVARVLGISAVTVRVHICAARRKIRHFLEEDR